MILLLDNYDSFVHNLARHFRCLDRQTVVRRSDEISLEECAALRPEAIVLSPGPRRPADAGCCVEVVREMSSSTPMLGVCLGHQCICVAFGGSVDPCEPFHGMASQIRHDGRGLFDSCPLPMSVGRYHALAARTNHFPPELQITATADDGTIMGIQHVQRPVFGVQFHPESILTESGLTLLRNFVELASSFQQQMQRRSNTIVPAGRRHSEERA